MLDDPSSATPAQNEAVEIVYTDGRGRRAVHHILPIDIVFDSNQFNPEPQWHLEAFDMEAGEPLFFAIKDIHSWSVWRDRP